MGGDSATGGKRQSGKKIKNWLHWHIDLLAHEYGWQKSQIFDLYPREVEHLEAEIERRKDEESDADLMRQIMAARVPMSKDGGEQLISVLKAKHGLHMAVDDVTHESIARDMKMARRMLRR